MKQIKKLINWIRKILGGCIKDKMNIYDVIKKFEFIFVEEGITKDLEVTKNNLETLESKAIYKNICLEYLKKQISKMEPITLLTNLGILFVGESTGSIEYGYHIQQFELDFMQALAVKYCKMKMFYNKTSNPQDIEQLLKVIRIYQMCIEHELHRDNHAAYILNSKYRITRMEGFDERKTEMIKQFCVFYDNRVKSSKIKLCKVLKFVEIIVGELNKKFDDLTGHVINLAEQYDFFVFSKEKIKKICVSEGFNYNKVIKIIEFFSCYIGDFSSIDEEEIYLNNPSYKKFVIKLDAENFFVPNINIVAENIMEIMEEILKYEEQDVEAFFDSKAKYLESKTVELVKNKYQEYGKIYTNSEWDDDGRHGENDVILIIENYAIIFEDKSGKVNKNTVKGIINSALKDNKKLIKEPTEQALRFSKLIEKNLNNTLTLKVRGGGKNVIDLTNVNNILRIGVIFEETALQNINLDGEKHIPIVSIYQLDKILFCLSQEEVVDYLCKRTLIEDNTRYKATEYDILYNYLLNGINNSREIYQRFNEKQVLYFAYTEQHLSRKILQREDWFEKVIKHVKDIKEQNWLDKIIMLLEISPIAQKQIWRSLKENRMIILQDNILERNKVIVVECLEYCDSDTENDIIVNIQKFTEFENIVYIAFTEEMAHIYVKVKKGTQIF